MNQQGKIVVGYHNIRGIAHALRAMLVFKGVSFEDRRFNSWDDWMQVKPTLNTAFPNLPYLEHPALPFTLTESKAILEFLAKELNLHGNSSAEGALIDNVIFVTEDVRSHFVSACYGTSAEAWPKKAEELRAWLPGALASLEKHAAARKSKWIASESVSAADFFLFEVLATLFKFAPNVFAADGALRKFHDQFFALPELQKFFQDNANLPFNNTMAAWK